MNAIALKNLYGDQLTEAPKVKRERKTSGYANHLGWVFMTNHLHHKPKAARTYKTLFAIGNDYTYFTPNTFFQKQSREVASLRWINAFSVDIDIKYTSGTTLNVAELLDSIDSVGLPEPALIVRTPSGGVHVHWYLDKPKRAFKRVCEHYKRITGLIIEELSEIGADGQANGPERFFRTPTEENTIYQSQNRVSLQNCSVVPGNQPVICGIRITCFAKWQDLIYSFSNEKDVSPPAYLQEALKIFDQICLPREFPRPSSAHLP